MGILAETPSQDLGSDIVNVPQMNLTLLPFSLEVSSQETFPNLRFIFSGTIIRVGVLGGL